MSKKTKAKTEAPVQEAGGAGGWVRDEQYSSERWMRTMGEPPVQWEAKALVEKDGAVSGFMALRLSEPQGGTFETIEQAQAACQDLAAMGARWRIFANAEGFGVVDVEADASVVATGLRSWDHAIEWILEQTPEKSEDDAPEESALAREKRELAGEIQQLEGQAQAVSIELGAAVRAKAEPKAAKLREKRESLLLEARQKHTRIAAIDLDLQRERLAQRAEEIRARLEELGDLESPRRKHAERVKALHTELKETTKRLQRELRHEQHAVRTCQEKSMQAADERIALARELERIEEKLRAES